MHLPERAYGSDCRLTIPGKGINWEVIKGTLFDEFVVAHTLGWWGKALILRNYLLLWILSVGFELCELTFQHMLPNFNECWWDSWILDVAVCNFGGLLAGMATVRCVSAFLPGTPLKLATKKFACMLLTGKPLAAQKKAKALKHYTRANMSAGLIMCLGAVLAAQLAQNWTQHTCCILQAEQSIVHPGLFQGPTRHSCIMIQSLACVGGLTPWNTTGRG